MPRTTKKTKTGRRRLGRGLGSLLNTPVAIDMPDAEEAPAPASAPPIAAAPDEPRPDAQPHAASIAPPPPPSPAAFAEAKPVTPAPLTDHEDLVNTNFDDGGPKLISLAIDRIVPNPRQPRQHFDDESLAQLAASIKREGVMSPILVRPMDKAAADNPANAAATAGGAGGFELIAGERRWRAARIAGLAAIPTIVRYVDDRAAAEISIIENLQREDLNPMERAEAFRRLVDEFGATHEDIAESVNLDRATVTNTLRLNELDDATKTLLRRGELSMGHARALLGITNIETRTDLARRAARNQWSVRETETQARRITHVGPGAMHTGTGNGDATGGSAASAATAAEAHLKDLQQRLESHLGTKVQIHTGRKKGSGRLIIQFYDLDQFEGLMAKMGFDSSE